MNKFFFICFIIFLINNENVGAAPSFGLGTSQSYRDAEERNNLKRKNQRNDFYEALNSYLNFCLELSEKDINNLMFSVTGGDYLYMKSLGDPKKILNGYNKKLKQNC